MKPNNLRKHPEGGSYQEVFRSANLIANVSNTGRSALTHIYFSLASHERSRFHRVDADEVWNLYSGQGMYLYIWDGTKNSPETITLSAEENCFCHVIPAGSWQAAEPIAGEVLVGCSVAPGFEFDGFTLMSRTSAEAEMIRAMNPELERLIYP